MEVKRKNGLTKGIFIAAVFITVLFTALQIILSFLYYEEEVNLYISGTSLPNYFNIAFAVVLIVIFIISFFIKKDSIPSKLPAADRLTCFFAMLTGFIFIISAFFSVYYYHSGRYTSISEQRIAVIILSVTASVYFIITAVAAHPRRTPYVFCGFFVIIWACIYLICIYFEMDAPLNSPMRISNQISLLVIMIYFLYELRYMLVLNDSPSSALPKPRLYFVFSIIAFVIVLPVSINDIVLTFSGFRSSGINTYYRIAEFAIALYIFARCRSAVWDETPILVASVPDEANEIEE